MRKKMMLGLLFLMIFSAAFIFSPYNPILELTEKMAVKDFISSDDMFKGLKVIDIDYRGSDTYFIQTEDGGSGKNFIVMRYNTSVMNGHWKVFEETSQEQFY